MCFIDVTISQDTNNLTRALNKSYHQKSKHLKLAVCFLIHLVQGVCTEYYQQYRRNETLPVYDISTKNNNHAWKDILI